MIFFLHQFCAYLHTEQLKKKQNINYTYCRYIAEQKNEQNML